jgi:prophage antirepressor-like protein
MENRSNLPAILDFVFEQTYHCRSAFDTRSQTAYVCLPDLLKAQGSTTHPHQVLPEIEEIFGDGGKIVFPIPDVLGRIQDTIFISEHAATYVVSRGRTEKAKRLNRWLFMEVLPAIRKSGCYNIQQGLESGIPLPIPEAVRFEQAAKYFKSRLDTMLEMRVAYYPARKQAIQDTLLMYSVDLSSCLPRGKHQEDYLDQEILKHVRRACLRKPGVFFKTLMNSFRYMVRDREELLEKCERLVEMGTKECK